MPSPNNRGSWPEGPDEVERLLLFPTAAQCPFSLCSCRAWRIRASAGLRGQIWANAAFRSLTIRKYSLRSGPCLNPNLLRGNCAAPVSWHFSRDFCAQRARLGSTPSKRGETKSAEKGRSQAVPSRIRHARRKWTKRESTPGELRLCAAGARRVVNVPAARLQPKRGASYACDLEDEAKPQFLPAAPLLGLSLYGEARERQTRQGGRDFAFSLPLDPILQTTKKGPSPLL